MIEDIYKNIVYSSEYMQEKAKEVDEDIDGVLNNDRRSLDNNEYEKKEICFLELPIKQKKSRYINSLVHNQQ